MASTISLVTGSAAAVQVEIDLGQERSPISPWIYGFHGNAVPLEEARSMRLGGNRFTTYNWENNASNAGADYRHISDDYLTSSVGIDATDPRVDQPGSALTVPLDRFRLAQGYAVVTVPMAGYVAHDKAGAVSMTEEPPSPRWVEVSARKNGPHATTPDLTDGRVYIDEMVHFLRERYGDGAHGGVRGYSLDNEPELWVRTHPRIHPFQTTCEELFRRSIAYARAIKGADPSAEVFGPGSYGWHAFMDLESAPDWASVRGAHTWFLGWYLAQMAAAGRTAGQRLLDVLDVHYYPEARGPAGRIVFTSTGEANAAARVQAPRSLWDQGYVENSWLTKVPESSGGSGGKPLALLARLRETIATHYPGTKIAVSEWDFGGGTHVSGGLATADVLGIFGRFGVYLANYWAVEEGPFTRAAFDIYRNYNGCAAEFGNLSVSTSSSDPALMAAYASVPESTDRRLHLIVINRDLVSSQPADVHIAGAAAFGSAKVFGFGGTSATITERTVVSSIQDNSFHYDVPPATVLHFVLEPGTDALADAGICQPTRPDACGDEGCASDTGTDAASDTRDATTPTDTADESSVPGDSGADAMGDTTSPWDVITRVDGNSPETTFDVSSDADDGRTHSIIDSTAPETSADVTMVLEDTPASADTRLTDASDASFDTSTRTFPRADVTADSAHDDSNTADSAGGCACQSAGRSSPPWTGLFWLTLMLAATRRRSRRRGDESIGPHGLLSHERAR